jgi:GTP-binding protein
MRALLTLSFAERLIRTTFLAYSMIENLRNIAIIAHVDHGKTTLVDKLLAQSGTFDEHAQLEERMMDSNELEKERGITILAKNTAIRWTSPAGIEYRINIVDTPGHADFGGEVERVLSMVDCVCLLVDAVDGPMPQTRFVTEKAFAMGLNPIVVINKIDRPGARPDWVMDQVFELFDRLGGTDEQLDFPVVYASAINGYAGLEEDVDGGDMTPLFQTIVDKVHAPKVDPDGPFQMQISQLDYNSFQGVIGIGRIQRGIVKANSQLTVVDHNGESRKGRILQIMGFHGLKRIEVKTAQAGDIVAITGMDDLRISDTLCDPAKPEMLPPLTVDEPTISMTFGVNKSPFAGQDGKLLTTRQVRERLERELKINVALRVENTEDPDRFKVSGRGQLHLSILIETMRREGFELAISRPEVIVKEVDGVLQEPYELLLADVEEQHQGSVIDTLNKRKGMLRNMEPDGRGRIRLEYIIPARGMIGLQTEFMSMTSGSGIITHIFDHFGEIQKGNVGQRHYGALVSMAQGKSLDYALFTLQDRGRMMVENGDMVYEGQVVGMNSRDSDMVVNTTKAKQLTNVRASGTDENLVLVPKVDMTLEQALEFINQDELVEVTPKVIRVRKLYLKESERKRHARS